MAHIRKLDHETFEAIKSNYAKISEDIKMTQLDVDLPSGATPKRRAYQ